MKQCGQRSQAAAGSVNKKCNPKKINRKNGSVEQQKCYWLKLVSRAMDLESAERVQYIVTAVLNGSRDPTHLVSFLTPPGTKWWHLVLDGVLTRY